MIYFDGTGTPSNRILPISANGYVGIFQGDPVNGTPAAGAYTATISNDLPVAVTVNEVAPASGIARQSTSYNGFAAGVATANLPLVESAGAGGWSTGEGIMTTGSTATTVTITYYDTSTGAQIGTPAQQAPQPNAFGARISRAPGCR